MSAFEVFFDGECPLCKREIAVLRRLERGRGLIVFTDISKAGFDPTPLGLDYATLMARIHGRLPDGRIVEGVEVFRQLYEALGLRTLVRLSRLSPVARVLDAGYGVFARNRLRITGRCDAHACSRPTEA